jgi:CDP-diacylglycerol--glycerol-3-phosphate 3-phosphatidyltransferase
LRANQLNRLPHFLVLLRAALAPVLVALALFYPSGVAFAACLVTGFLSDYFDGIIARHLGVATENLRRMDSAADSLFYICATFAVWHLQPEAILARQTPLVLLVGLELFRYVFDLAKFRREASYHMWSSKLWGLFLFAGFLSLLGFESDNTCVDLMVYLGIFADIEGIAISLTLRDWKADVPSIVHAIKLRCGRLAA